MWREIRQTLKLGWPIVLVNLSQMILGVIDSAMVGAIHSSQLAAAAFVNNLISIPLILGAGLATAVSPLVAAALGQGDTDKPLRILFNALIIAALISLTLATAIHLGIDLVFYFGQDQIVAELAQPYLLWMSWGIVPMVLFMTMKQFADGLEQPRIPMYLALAAIPINVALNYAFIYGEWGAPRMELEGAGVGTLFSRLIIMLSIGLLILRGKTFARYRQRLKQQLRLRFDRMRDVIRLGIPASLQYGMESAAFAVSGIMAGWLGYVQQAAHQIAISIVATTFMVAMGVSAAGSIRIGNAYGRRDWGHARHIGFSTLFMGVFYGLFCAGLFVGGRNQLPLLFNDETAVLGYAASLLFVAAVFQISDSVQAIGVGLLRGLQDVRVPTVFVLLAYWVIGLPSGYYLAFNLGLEVVGIWIGLLLGLSASATLLSLRFNRITGRVRRPLRP